MSSQELKEIRAELAEIRDSIAANAASTAELVEMYRNIKGLMQVLSWVERFSIWIAKLAAAGAIFYAGWKNFKS